jgi:hypothetical protein
MMLGCSVRQFSDDDMVRVRFVVFVEELILGGGFEAVGAIETPAGLGHPGDEKLLVFGGRGVFLLEGFKKLGVGAVVLVRENGEGR